MTPNICISYQGKELGPTSLCSIATMLASGKLDHTACHKLEGAAEWKTIGELDFGSWSRRAIPDTSLLAQSSREFYAALATSPEAERVPFLLIDSKSLPRSGLHFLKQSLGKLFGDHFSFCEWYQEPGCCKSMPCALTCFASRAEETGSLRIRLTKSHDLDLQDPVYQAGPHLRRLILVRQPIYVLTSWFALDQLRAHREELSQRGIVMNKIDLHHESEVVSAAFKCLDDCYRPPSPTELQTWLEDRRQYCEGFMNKWVTPLASKPCDFTSVVRYENLSTYLRSLVSEYGEFVNTNDRPKLDAVMSRLEASFKPRPDPFSTPSPRLTAYLKENASFFSNVASPLGDRPCFMAATSHNPR